MFIFGDVEMDDKVISITRKHGKGDTYIIPGLVDIHTHGGGGDDFSDGDPEGLKRLDRYYLTRGVTSYLATTMTVSEPELMKAVTEIGRAELTGLKGIHLEGPFINYNKRGAQAGENILKPDIALFRRLNKASGGKIRLVTVAPETEGALEFIHAASKICAVSVGHTEANFDEALRAFETGATHVTHLFNAMPPMLHRAPSVVGAAHTSHASVELICDGLHVSPPVIRMVFAMFGMKVNIVSDSLRCAGLKDGEYTLGGQPIFMRDGKATLKDGTLAGSSVDLLEEIRRAVSFGVPIHKAIYAATTAPAKAIGLNVGSLEPSAPADAVILDKTFNILDVLVAGKSVL